MPSNKQASKCNCSCGCSCAPDEKETKRRIVIDFMFLDLSVCSRCQGTDDSLEDAIRDVAKVLESTGTEVIVNKIHITSEEQAIKHKFISSPTIRVNGKDIQLEVKETICESCGDLCGSDVDCRVWVYNDKEYNVPPKGMIVDAILREVYTGSGIARGGDDKVYILPENLKSFFEAIKNKKQ